MTHPDLSYYGFAPPSGLPRLCGGERLEPRQQAMSCKRIEGTDTWLVWARDTDGQEQTLRLSRSAVANLARIMWEAVS